MSNLPKQITISSALDLERYARNGLDQVVSILDPDSPEPVELRAVQRRFLCTLRFHDVVEDSGPLISPQASHIDKLLDFGRSLSSDPGRHLLIHCFAGLCRSTAAALVLIAQSDPSASPERAVTRLLEITPHAWPNTRMVQLGDECLQLNGRLVRALDMHYEAMCRLYPGFGRLMRHGSLL
jgi:predicted protein tyrosine phosphatase